MFKILPRSRRFWLLPARRLSKSGLGAGSIPTQTTEVGLRLAPYLPGHGHSQAALSGEADSRKSADGASSGFLGCVCLFQFQQDD